MNHIIYDEWSKHYDPKNKEMQVLAELGINFHDKKVLEVGAGTGRFTQRILPFCKEIVCVDPDDEALLVLRDNISDKKVSVLKGTLETVPLEKEYFDYVVFSWSMYLIDEKEKDLQICYDSLISGGGVVVLQAYSGEYESEVGRLYNRYDSMGVYDTTCEDLIKVIEKVFGRVTCGTLNSFFSFDSIDQVIEFSLNFVEDEEGELPSEIKINSLRDRLSSYVTPEGNIKMSDTVSIFIAYK